MSSSNIDSQSFNAKSYFKNFVKDKSVEEVIRKNNKIFHGMTIFHKFIYRDQDSR